MKKKKQVELAVVDPKKDSKPKPEVVVMGCGCRMTWQGANLVKSERCPTCQGEKPQVARGKLQALRTEREERLNPRYLEYREQLDADAQIERLNAETKYLEQADAQIRPLAHALLAKYSIDSNDPPKVRELVKEILSKARGALEYLDQNPGHIASLIERINDETRIESLSAQVEALVEADRRAIAILATGGRAFAGWAEEAKSRENQLDAAIERSLADERQGRGASIPSQAFVDDKPKPTEVIRNIPPET